MISSAPARRHHPVRRRVTAAGRALPTLTTPLPPDVCGPEGLVVAHDGAARAVASTPLPVAGALLSSGCRTGIPHTCVGRLTAGAVHIEYP